MTQRIPVQCDSCVHRITASTCAAFPQRIPDAIVLWAAPHNRPVDGQDNTITWDLRSGAQEAKRIWDKMNTAKVK